MTPESTSDAAQAVASAQKLIEAAPLTDAQRLGRTPLNAEAAMPEVNVDEPNINLLARNICENLPPFLIYRRDKLFLTVKPGSKPNREGVLPINVRPICADKLCSVLGDHLYFVRGSGEKAKRVALSKSLAEKILKCDEWIDRSHELELILPVRLPVWGETVKGRRSIELAPVGYDPDRALYTAETLNYSGGKRYTPAQLVAGWNRIMYSFPWADESKEESAQTWSLDGKPMKGACPSTNRSACCCLALMLGQYCRFLVDDIMPIGLFNANQQGSGKSLLAWLCIAPVWGMAAGTAAPKNDEEMIKSLHAALRMRAPYHMLDDIQTLANNTINMLATSNEVSGRLLGGLEMFTAKNYMQIFATGNNVGTSADVERRSLIIDLFLAESAIERKFASPMTKKSLSRPSFRADLLRFMRSMVENWSEAGCPEHVRGSEKPTFESFASVIGSIMVHNGFASPFRERAYDGAGGDLITRTIKKLLAWVVTHEIGDDRSATFTVKELIEYSNGLNLTETISGNKDPNRSFGKRVEKLRGQILRDQDGRPFEFGKRKEAGQSSYTFTRVDV